MVRHYEIGYVTNLRCPVGATGWNNRVPPQKVSEQRISGGWSQYVNTSVTKLLYCNLSTVIWSSVMD